MTAWRLTAIVSGGQTGADRGAHDAAIDLALDYGGWMPAGKRAEDGVIPEIYASRMKETSSHDYGMRTRLNVQDSDGTLVVSFAPEPAGGTEFTLKTCARMRKPHLHIVLPAGGRSQMPDSIASEIREWIREARISVLNVAGPRESKEPGIQEATRDLLVWILEDEVAKREHICRVSFQCQACEVICCWDCEAPMANDSDMKTAVRWCKTPDCAAAEAKERGTP